MIHYLKGTLTMKFSDFIVVEVGGFGMKVHVPGNSMIYQNKEGDSIKVYTSMIVREDDMSLYGFSNEQGVEIFNKLITVNSVGAKAAMSILSSMHVEELRKAIIFEDVSMLTRANGIGKKTAQKIVLDLKDKLGEISTDETAQDAVSETYVPNGEKDIAIDALINLGYSKGEAMNALQGVKDDNLNAEDFIKLALKNI